MCHQQQIPRRIHNSTSNIMSFTPQDTANASPQMQLDSPEFTAYASSLLEKESQNSPNKLILEKSLEVVTCQVTPHGNLTTVGSTMLNRSGTLQECLNKLQKNENAHIGCQLSHRGVFRTIKSFVHDLGANSSMTGPTINSSF